MGLLQIKQQHALKSFFTFTNQTRKIKTLFLLYNKVSLGP